VLEVLVVVSITAAGVKLVILATLASSISRFIGTIEY
jgi:hypothetical protein